MCIKLRQQAIFNPRYSTQLFPSMRSCLYQDSGPGVMQTERVCLNTQTAWTTPTFFLSLLESFLLFDVCGFPSFSSGLRYGMNGNSGSCYFSPQLGEKWQPILNQSSVTGSPTTNKADCHWWVPKSRLLRHAGLATSQL